MPKNLARLGRKLGGDDDLAEDAGNGLGQVGVDGAVGHDDAAEGRLLVCLEGLFPARDEFHLAGHAAGIGVLEDGHGGLLKLADQVSGGGDVDDVVVGKFLALKLLEALVEAPVERGLLVRVLAVAQLLRQRHFQAQALGQADVRALGDLALQIGGDGPVVGGGALENLEGELAAQDRQRVAAGGESLQHGRVVRRVTDHGHAGVVLGRTAEHGGAADVDVLNGFLKGAVAAGDGFLEGVQVDADQVDHVDAVLLGLGEVVVLVAAAQQAAVDLRVQGLDPALHHLGEARVLAHIRDGEPVLPQELGRPPGGENAVAVLLDEALRKIHEAGFIADRN